MSKHSVPGERCVWAAASVRRTQAQGCGTDWPGLPDYRHPGSRSGRSFWIHRVPQSEGIESHVDRLPPSILTSRRRRRAKTDRVDGETLVRTLMAYKRGEPRVCSMARALDAAGGGPPACLSQAPDAGGRAVEARQPDQRAALRPRECSTSRCKVGVSDWRSCGQATAGLCRCTWKAQIIRELDRLEGPAGAVEDRRGGTRTPCSSRGPGENGLAGGDADAVKGYRPRGPPPSSCPGPVPPVRQPQAARWPPTPVWRRRHGERFDRSRARVWPRPKPGRGRGQPAIGQAGLGYGRKNQPTLGAQPVVPRAGPPCQRAAAAGRSSSPWRASSSSHCGGTPPPASSSREP